MDDDSGDTGGGDPVEGGGEAIESDEDTDGGEDAGERSANTTLSLEKDNGVSMTMNEMEVKSIPSKHYGRRNRWRGKHRNKSRRCW